MKGWWVALLLLGCGEKDSETPVGEDSAEVDGDGDGYTQDAGDCDDGDAAVHPGAEEVWYDGVDSDCGGENDFDQDADGVTLDAGDCDDQDPNAEGCTPWYIDQDGDGYGAGLSMCLCEGDEASGYTTPLGTDCDDETATIYPGVPEVCDGLDNNCDGVADEGVTQTYYLDRDLDGYGQEEVQACALPDGAVELGGDCDDGDDKLHPDAREYCDGIDNNCDVLRDDDDPALDLNSRRVWYVDSDGDGFGEDDGAWVQACFQPSGYASASTDCDDTDASVHPGAREACDSLVDLNCSGVINGTLTECIEGYVGEHEILLDKDHTKAISCEAVWSDVGTTSAPCPNCIWTYEINSVFEASLSKDGGYLGKSCFDSTGSSDYTLTLGYDPDFYGYGYGYLWYYAPEYGNWYPFSYATLDSSGSLDWTWKHVHEYQYYSGGYYSTFVFRGSATVQ